MSSKDMRAIVRRLAWVAVFVPYLLYNPARADDVSTLAAIIDFKPKLGDLAGNIRSIERLVSEALGNAAKIVVVPEQATTGFDITRAQALAGLAIASPFPELSGIIAAAKNAGALVTLGIAERDANSNALYNSAVIILPSGEVRVQRKRLASSAAFGWNDRGDTPFDIYPTPWGDVAVLICADTFLMDWLRIVTLKGADIVLLPSNWWGKNRQVELWRARARQDGVWILAANRWGTENNLFPPPGSYYMSDGPSAVISPSGLALQSYEADDSSTPGDKILYQTITVDRARIGGQNQTFSVANRRPSAYPALANTYYVPPANAPVPNLPPPSALAVELLAYQPSRDAAANFQTVLSMLAGMSSVPDELIVLPGLGLTEAPIVLSATPDWNVDPYWSGVMKLVADRHAQGLVTSVLTKTAISHDSALAVAFVTADGVTLYQQIHDSGSLVGSGTPPAVVRLKNAAVALMTGIDSLFPEVGTQVAKSGADIAIVVSAIGGRGGDFLDVGGITASLPRGWTIDDLERQWQTMANGCMHIVAADASGYSFIANQAAYCQQGQSVLASEPIAVSLDPSTQRTKLLNWYYDFDLQSLLAPPALSPGR
jgi:predicted amidohydrolase